MYRIDNMTFSPYNMNLLNLYIKNISILYPNFNPVFSTIMQYSTSWCPAYIEDWHKYFNCIYIKYLYMYLIGLYIFW